MEYYYSNRSGGQIPAFGSWDCSGDLPYTQCFETVHPTAAAAFVHYTHDGAGDLYAARDLYAAGELFVAGDLYANDAVSRPAMIVVPRRRKAKLELHEKVENNNEDGKGQLWEVGDFNKEPQSPIIRQKNPKPVDEDLYKISPHLLYAKTNKKRKGLSFFSCWMMPSCGL